MPTTRKKLIKTVYKDEDDSDAGGDFSDSGSDAKISEASSEEEDIISEASSAEEFTDKPIPQPKGKQRKSVPAVRKTKFAKSLISKIRQTSADSDEEAAARAPTITVKDLTEKDKLLPSFLNLSESDSSDDEGPEASTSKTNTASTSFISQNLDSDNEAETKMEYNDVFSTNVPDNSEEVAKQTFLELEKHKTKIEEAKASVQKYSSNNDNSMEVDVKDLLAQGEEAVPEIKAVKKTTKSRKKKDDSDSEIEDWEEVNEAKAIPQHGIQLIVDFPDAACRKSKKLDLEMMMKRKINRVKKEYQAYMHKVHILCWLGHGNYVSRVLNDQELLASVLTLIPSSGCYPGERIELKYVEEITTWFKDKITIKHDKNENKFRPKAPPLKDTLLSHIKNRLTTTNKYLVFIFVALMRSLGLQCRIMFNFVSLPIKPPSSELCSLSTKQKEKADDEKLKSNSVKKEKNVKAKPKSKSKAKISQVDGNDDSYMSYEDEEFDNIMQVDGNDDTQVKKTRSIRASRVRPSVNGIEKDNEDVSPPKKAKLSLKPVLATVEAIKSDEITEKRKRINRKSKTPEPNKKETLNNDVKGNKDSKNSNLNKNTEKNIDIKSKCTTSSIRNSRFDRKSKSPEPANKETLNNDTKKIPIASNSSNTTGKDIPDNSKSKIPSPRKTRSNSKSVDVNKEKEEPNQPGKMNNKPSADRENPSVKITNEDGDNMTSSSYFDSSLQSAPLVDGRRKRNRTAPKNMTTSYMLNGKSTNTKQESKPIQKNNKSKPESKITSDDKAKTKSRAKSAPENSIEKSKYFNTEKTTPANRKLVPSSRQRKQKEDVLEDAQRVSHKDLLTKSPPKKNDVTGDLIHLIKGRVKEAKIEARKRIVKGRNKKESDDDSDFLPEEDPKERRNTDSDDDFKPTKISPRPAVKKRIDRRVLSTDDEVPKNKIDVWCEVFVDELEQWVPVDVTKAKVHCAEALYKGATHPVAYILGWDNNNYLKDLTRRYAPHFNTMTRKLRVDQPWWDTALRPWVGPRNARDREEDELLNRAQLDAPLPKAISEYKNHPLYALSRHLLKFEAIYPADATTLGFIRGEAVYPRDCVYVCRSRDIWLKEAKTVKLGEKPYKIVKSRPKWDRLSNKLINGQPLEIFGPWQVQDYEPPTAENGVVPRNAYGNVELFKMCMLPKGTVHVRLPGLHKVAKKLNIDAAPAVTGFDFNGGYSHPVFDGYVVCKEFEEIITEAWLKDQEDQERKEQEKYETRVYGNWKRLIKGLLIKQRLKNKYGFEEPSTSTDSKKKANGPKLVVKKRP